MTEIVGQAPWVVVHHELNGNAVGALGATPRDGVIDAVDNDVHLVIVPQPPRVAVGTASLPRSSTEAGLRGISRELRRMMSSLAGRTEM